ncbi:MAG: hypothetical protein Unbinned2691contig1000_29 [Prokaryotic dsDNA virus sp.]|nr:MAG: hypothetical protein Unbinned2691contig1000_29 [Prokaryotic dsDNA virus sp.]|tara:strand:+ start:1627 stop:1926 length:300 start_codon:yes stop_codon:yes gene_type:complete
MTDIEQLSDDHNGPEQTFRDTERNLRDHVAALEARNARLEEQVREAYERAAEAAEGERYAQHYVDASASAGDMRPDIHNEACNDVAEAIRTLTTEQANG